MGSSIILRTIGGIDDKRIDLDNSQFARVMSIGTTWNSIRIGLRWSFTDSGGNITGTPRFAFGVCSGTTNIFGDATCDNFVGAISNTASWTRNAGPPVWYNSGGFTGPYMWTARKVGASLTLGNELFAGSGESFAVAADPATGYRSVMLLTITKGSPNYTLQLFYTLAAYNVDVSYADFYALVDAAVPARTNYLTSLSRTIACDESTGSFNAVNFHWSKASPNIELSDIAVARLS